VRSRLVLRGKWPSIGLLAVCEILAMTVWFSAAAILPALRQSYALDNFQSALLTSAVSVGFVAGTLVSALLGLPDRIDPRRLFAASALVAAIANAGMLMVSADSLGFAALRFIAGACAAGIYPVGMKMASTWAVSDRGLLVGILVGAQTAGLATPHLIDAWGGVDWRFTLEAASASTVVAALLVGLVGLGPAHVQASAFRARSVLQAWQRTSLRLANLGYLGHMWELFAMWGWLGIFLSASFAIRPGGPDSAVLAKLLTFASVAMGAAGCILGGLVADRIGRTTLTVAAMAISGTCCLLAGPLFGGDPSILCVLCLVWGCAVVADSPQFTASVIELSDRSLTGTMITVQTCAGFLLTTVTIHLTPFLVEWIGWRHAFAVLALGPALGIWAMLRLRFHPDAVRLANGRR